MTLTLARAAMRYRAEARRLRRQLEQATDELRDVRAANYRLSATVRRMDATNAALTHAQAAADFRPHGRFGRRETP